MSAMHVLLHLPHPVQKNLENLQYGILKFAIIPVPLACRAVQPEIHAPSHFCEGLQLTGIPHPVSTARLTVEAHIFPDIKTVTGGADIRAVSTGQASFFNLFPNLAVEGPPKSSGRYRAGIETSFSENLSLPLSQIGKLLQLGFTGRLKGLGGLDNLLSLMGIDMNHKVISEVGKEEIISATGEVCIHQAAASMFVAVVVAFQPDNKDIRLSCKIVVILGTLGKYHVQALNAGKVASVDPEEHHLFIPHNCPDVNSLPYLVCQQCLLLGHKIFFRREDRWDVIQGYFFA